MWWYGYNGGIASYAVAAIDIALWDIKGKLLGVPVVQLLGGAVHEKLPAVASSHAHYEDIDRMVEEAQEWVAPGMHGLKVGFGKRGNARLGYEHDRDVEYIRKMREGLGPDQMIMIDCGWNVKWDVMTAVRRVQAFDEYGLHWIEEPLGAWDPEGYANLRCKTTIAHRLRREGVERRGLRARARRPGPSTSSGIDPGRAEGITGFKRAVERIEFYRRQANAHCWSSAIVHRRQPGDELQLAGLQADRGQAAPQPDAARAGARADRAPRRLVLPADEARAGHRGHRGGRRPLSQREGARPAEPARRRRHEHDDVERRRRA